MTFPLYLLVAVSTYFKTTATNDEGNIDGDERIILLNRNTIRG